MPAISGARAEQRGDPAHRREVNATSGTGEIYKVTGWRKRALDYALGEERLAALESECARLVALSAVRVRLLPADGDNESCLVMQDIEGNEFCLD